MDLEAFAQLLASPGQRLLATAMAADPADILATSERLRRQHPPALVAAAMGQAALRRAATEKFGADASAMYFTPAGLEQATHSVVARHRASRIAASGHPAVVDLCCGIGSDLIAIARAVGGVRGVDQDPVAAGVARANLAALGLPGTVDIGDAADFADVDGLVFADPARRGPRGRVFDPAMYSPPWPVVERLLGRDAVVKLAPGLPHRLVPTGVEAEWVSLDGRLREAVLWSGSLAQTSRRATVLRSGDRAASIDDADDRGPAAVRPVGRFLYEPDDAVVRAHLVAAFATSVGGWLVEEHLAYVSSDDLVASPLGRCYEVVDVLPFKEKALRAALRARDVGTLTIKKRGVDITPEVLRKRLGLTGSVSATIVLTRTPASAVALLVEPR